LQPSRFKTARRIMARLLLICCATAILLGAAACPYAGRYLIIDDPLQPADAIVLLAGAHAERWLEAVDLYREGIAPHILMSPGIVEPAEVRVREMGIRFPSQAELARDAMTQMGVPASAITVLPGSVDNTADEAARARPVVSERGWTSLVVVTSKYHTRRTRFSFQREFRGTPVRVQVRGSRYDNRTPARWWTSRSDQRYVITELQKLAAYRLGLDR
jgi:uncharacterized SAM-binding protein YcdF (DUF218 family)